MPVVMAVQWDCQWPLKMVKIPTGLDPTMHYNWGIPQPISISANRKRAMPANGRSYLITLTSHSVVATTVVLCNSLRAAGTIDAYNGTRPSIERARLTQDKCGAANVTHTLKLALPLLTPLAKRNASIYITYMLIELLRVNKCCTKGIDKGSHLTLV